MVGKKLKQTAFTGHVLNQNQRQNDFFDQNMKIMNTNEFVHSLR